jgi:hypothetical protein
MVKRAGMGICSRPLSIQVGGLRSYNQDVQIAPFTYLNFGLSSPGAGGRFQLWVSVAETPGNRAEFLLPCRRDPNQLAKSIEQE